MMPPTEHELMKRELTDAAAEAVESMQAFCNAYQRFEEAKQRHDQAGENPSCPSNDESR